MPKGVRKDRSLITAGMMLKDAHELVWFNSGARPSSSGSSSRRQSLEASFGRQGRPCEICQSASRPLKTRTLTRFEGLKMAFAYVDIDNASADELKAEASLRR